MRQRKPKTKTVTTVAEYDGEPSVAIHATQFGSGFTPLQARRIVDDWVLFLASGHSPIQHLEFVSRTPARLFEAVAGQPQLRSLKVKWGDYEGLSPLSELRELTTLHLRGASMVTGIEPLRGHHQLLDLVIEGFRALDTAPLGNLSSLTSLELGGSCCTP